MAAENPIPGNVTEQPLDLFLPSQYEQRFVEATASAEHITHNLFPILSDDEARDVFPYLQNTMQTLRQKSTNFKPGRPMFDGYVAWTNDLQLQIRPEIREIYTMLFNHISMRLHAIKPRSITPELEDGDRLYKSNVRSAVRSLSRNAAYHTIHPDVDHPFKLIADYYSQGGGPLSFRSPNVETGLYGHINNGDSLVCFDSYQPQLLAANTHPWNQHAYIDHPTNIFVPLQPESMEE